jgi:class 3 adenylate cyclase
MRGRRPGGARDLRTVLFTDIVGSTERASQLGDRAWGDLLARHHAAVRAALRETGGREVDTAGDGFFATFARPTDALACAARIVRAMGPLGLQVRVGLHAGEVETRDGKASGITVHTAARLMAAAAPDEVLASATVRELAAGAGWTFADRGSLELKGLAEPIHAYALDLAAASASLPLGRVGPGSALRGVPPVPAIGAVVVVGLVIVLAAVALAGGGGAHPSPTPTAVAAASATPPATTAPPSSSASPSAPGSVIDSASDLALEPGAYTTPDLPGAPKMTVIDAGWSATSSGLGDLILFRTTSPNDRMTMQWIRDLVPDPCGQQRTVPVGPGPEAQSLAWAHGNRALQLSEALPRQFGDLAATELDVSVVEKDACQYTEPVSVAVTDYEPGNRVTKFGLVLDAGARLRVEVSSHDGKLIIIVIKAPSVAEFQTFEPLAEKLLSTLKFSP